MTPPALPAATGGPLPPTLVPDPAALVGQAPPVDPAAVGAMPPPMRRKLQSRPRKMLRRGLLAPSDYKSGSSSSTDYKNRDYVDYGSPSPAPGYNGNGNVDYSPPPRKVSPSPSNGNGGGRYAGAGGASKFLQGGRPGGETGVTLGSEGCGRWGWSARGEGCWCIMTMS